MSENQNADTGDAPQMVSLTDLDLKSLAEVKKQLEEVRRFLSTAGITILTDHVPYLDSRLC